VRPVEMASAAQPCESGRWFGGEASGDGECGAAVRVWACVGNV